MSDCAGSASVPVKYDTVSYKSVFRRFCRDFPILMKASCAVVKIKYEVKENRYNRFHENKRFLFEMPIIFSIYVTVEF